MQGETKSKCEASLAIMFEKNKLQGLENQFLNSANEKLINENKKLKKAIDEIIETCIHTFNNSCLV